MKYKYKLKNISNPIEVLTEILRHLEQIEPDYLTTFESNLLQRLADNPPKPRNRKQNANSLAIIDSFNSDDNDDN